MKVHFITSRPTLEHDIDVLREIIDIIRDAGHTLARDWIEDAYLQNGGSQKDIVSDWSLIYRQNLEAIAQCDVVIAETSYENFAVGYQIAIAVQQKKPILLLRRHSADKNSFINGVEEGWTRREEYDEQTLSNVVSSFLEENDIKSKDMRFNFFIDRKIYNYLRWSALRTGKTKAEVLRELVEKEIDRESTQV